MKKKTLKRDIKRLERQIHHLSLNQHRLAEIVNATANRQVITSRLEHGRLEVCMIDEPEHMAAIDGANLQ